MAVAHRLDHIAPFHVMAILEKAKALEAAKHDVIHMEIGEPDFPTPAPIVAAGMAALQNGRTFYTPKFPGVAEIVDEHPPKRQQQAAAAKAPEITPFTS